MVSPTSPFHVQRLNAGLMARVLSLQLIKGQRRVRAPVVSKAA